MSILPTFCVKIIVNLFLWALLIIFVSPIVTMLTLYSKLSEFIVTCCIRKNFRSPNRMTDIVMCQDSSHSLTNTNIAMIWVVSGKLLSTDEFSLHFQNCFVKGNLPKYRNLFAYVKTYCKYSFYAHCDAQTFDVNWHIRPYSLKDFGDGSLQSFSAVWMTTNTYEKGRPAWQIAVIPLQQTSDGYGETGIVAKFNHALVDGYSLVHMVGELTGTPAPYLVTDKPQVWWQKAKCFFEAPMALLLMYVDLIFSRTSRSPFKNLVPTGISFADSSTEKMEWFASFASLDLESLKVIRRATDSHFVCLMITAQLGALRRLMLETMHDSELPKYLWIGSSLPLPNHPHILTNHWTMGYFKCPVRLEDPLKRLQFVENFYRKFKRQELDIKAFLFVFPFLRILPTWARRFLIYNDVGLQNASLFFGSLMLSTKTHQLLGREVKKLNVALINPDILPVSLFGESVSHGGQIDLCICASNAVVRSQEELDRLTRIYFIEEIESIIAAGGMGHLNVAFSQMDLSEIAESDCIDNQVTTL